MKNIVLLDDNFTLRQLIGIHLKDLFQQTHTDFRFYTSSNGVEGLGYIYITDPDLIIIDTTLPKYSGREVLDFLRLNKKYRKDEFRIIVLQEASENTTYPQNFIVLKKTDKNFLPELLAAIAHELSPKYQQPRSLFARLSNWLAHLTNKNDILQHNLAAKGLFGRWISYLIWLPRELVVSFFIAFIFLIKSQVRNENIEQSSADINKYRVRYYPSLVLGMSFLLMFLFQAGALLSSQLVLLRTITSPSFAATTFTVTSNADTADFAAGDGVCDTDDGVGDGPCTLRAAIQEANATAGTDTIQFAIATGYQQITTATALPAITEALTIDGSTQDSASCNPLSLAVEIYGPGSGNGITVSAANVVIRGLNINHYQHGIYANSTASNLTITCNIIGLDHTGTNIVGNTGKGIYLNQNNGTQIGGTTVSARNILSGNDDGVYTEFANTFNVTIQGNYIGTDVTGAVARGNTGFGLQLRAGNLQNIGTLIGGNIGTTPGGACTGACNVISGNGTSGIFSTGTPDGGLTIQGNFIGLDATGTQDLGNGQHGIYANRHLNALIGGELPDGSPDPYARNVISGNNNGVYGGIFYYQRTSTSQIIGNYIGTDTTGTMAIPNNYGVFFQASTSAINLNSVESNLISGNSTYGVYLLNSGQNVTNNTFSENIIGRNATNTANVPNVVGTYTQSVSANSYDANIVSGNTNTGFQFVNGDSNTLIDNIVNYNNSYGLVFSVGATNNNVQGGSISYNGFGVYMGDSMSTATTLQGIDISNNTIYGIYNNGSDSLQIIDNTIFENDIDGIYFSGSATSNSITGNQLLDNVNAGITISDAGSTSNTILDNLFEGNGTLALDLGEDGVTANDAGDGDAGANNLQNYPVLTAAGITTYNSDTSISYSFDSTAGDYLIQFFYSSAADDSNHGEAENYLCEHAISHPGGVGNYDTTCNVRASEDSYITATATVDLGGSVYASTSEFAANIQPLLFGIDGTVTVPNSFATAEALTVTVVDPDLNEDDMSIETVAVTVSNDNNGESETFVITENSANSDTFTASLPTSYGVAAAANNDGILTVAPGDNVTAHYIDQENIMGVADERLDLAIVSNASPNAVDDLATTSTGASVVVSVLGNDSDPENALDLNSLSITEAPAHGNTALNLINGTILFTAFSNYTGADSLEYEICDTEAACDTATVNLVINALSPTPTPTPMTTASATITVTTTPSTSPTPEPTVLRPTPTIMATIEPTRSLVSNTPLPQISILPETGSLLPGFISSLFDSKTLGETTVNTVVTLPAIVVLTTTAYTYPSFVIYAFAWIRFRKKVRPWGVVFDRLDLSPVAFARVALFQGNKLLEERVTDLHGRFGFVANKGEYTIKLNHPDYKKFSTEVKISKDDTGITQDIALEPRHTQGKKTGVSFRLRLKESLSRINIALFSAGFIFAIIATVITPVIYNYIILAIYCLQIGIAAYIRNKQQARRNWGYVYDIDNNSRVKGAFVRVYDTNEKNQIDIQMTDEAGRYGFILDPGHYLLSVDHADYDIPSKKNDLGRFFVSSAGKVLTNVTVKKNQTINIAVPADYKGDGRDSSLPSPFGS